MKSIVLRLALALAAFTVVPDALAAGSDSGNFFLDAKFGEAFGSHSGYSNSTQSAWGADAGYRWNLDDARSLGIDVGYMDLSQIADASDPLAFSSGGVTANEISLGGHFQVSMGGSKAWYFQARAGLTSTQFDQSYSNSPPGQSGSSGSYSWSQSGRYFGFGFGRHITQNLSLILAYNRFSSGDTQDQNGHHSGLNLNWLGLVAEYRF